MKITLPVLVAWLCSMCAACDLYFSTETVDEPAPADDEESPTDPPTQPTPDPSDEEMEPEVPDSLALDACDDLSFLGSEWLSLDSPHFRFHYLPGTAAEADLLEIQATREAAYVDISTTLGITAQPVLDVYLSPSRHAADAHGLSFGRAFPGYDRYEVVYTGADNSFERNHYGHLITANLVHYADSDHPQHLHILGVGINETLDAANRDMHQAYARRLNAGEESSTHTVDLEESDVWGSNRGRAGSLVNLLVDRYGWEMFLDIYRHTSMVWSQGCYRHNGGACIDSAASVTATLSLAVQTVSGDSWSEVRAMWSGVVTQALASAYSQLPQEDVAQIENILFILDDAVTSNDALLYRSAMDGFYCVWANEEERLDIARSVVESVPGSTSEVVAIYPLGINNFEEAVALVERTDEAGIVSQHRMSFERFPEGWRLTWTEEWR